jgi:hypothetical protein
MMNSGIHGDQWRGSAGSRAGKAFIHTDQLPQHYNVRASFVHKKSKEIVQESDVELGI